MSAKGSSLLGSATRATMPGESVKVLLMESS